jgi:hypothetical protein
MVETTSLVPFTPRDAVRRAEPAPYRTASPTAEAPPWACAPNVARLARTESVAERRDFPIVPAAPCTDPTDRSAADENALPTDDSIRDTNWRAPRIKRLARTARF